MRFMIAAALFTLLAAPAFAQQTEMDRAEREMRDTLAPAGVTVERRAPDEIVLNMPADITFDFDRAAVKGQFQPRLRDLARTLTTHPNMSIAIVGHADALGSDNYNQDLSERRARAVGANLMDYGVPYARISASGRGEWEPIASNATEWGRARNRRVEISVKAIK